MRAFKSWKESCKLLSVFSHVSCSFLKIPETPTTGGAHGRLVPSPPPLSTLALSLSSLFAHNRSPQTLTNFPWNSSTSLFFPLTTITATTSDLLWPTETWIETLGLWKRFFFSGKTFLMDERWMEKAEEAFLSIQIRRWVVRERSPDLSTGVLEDSRSMSTEERRCRSISPGSRDGRPEEVKFAGGSHAWLFISAGGKQTVIEGCW